MTRISTPIIMAICLMLQTGAFAHDATSMAHVGMPAPRGQGRPIMVQMTDYAYSIKNITVKSGETIRFIIANKGSLLHEFNINTEAEHAAHRPLMAKMMEDGMITTKKVVMLSMAMPDGSKMSHNEPNAVLIEPGKTAELSWTFGAPGELLIACNIPGHYESGMVAKVTVLPR